jgi:hypothetical protein
MKIDRALIPFKTKHGTPSFTALLSIPRHDRIPELIQTFDLAQVEALVLVMLTRFAASINVVRPMSSTQIVECAAAIVESAHEDYLSLQDLEMFFQQAIRGKYGRILDRLDQQTIFQMFEEYREERYKALRVVRDKEEHNSAAEFTRSEVRKKFESDRIDDGTLQYQLEIIKKEYGQE